MSEHVSVSNSRCLNMISVGCFVKLIDQKKHNFKFNPRPQFFFVIDIDPKKICTIVPCWVNKQPNKFRIYAEPNKVYSDVKYFLHKEKASLLLYEHLSVNNPQELIKIIKQKHAEISSKENKKLEKNQHISLEAQEYDLAVINNDRKKISKIEKRYGGDPRPNKGVTSSSLRSVSNAKPCIGGRVSPK